MSTLGKQRNGTRVVTDVVFRLGGAWEKLFLMTHILQYRAATDRQDSLADNPENAGKDCLGRAGQRPLVSGKVGPPAEEEEEAESTLSAAEWLRFIQQLLLLRLAARTAGTGHQSPGVGTRCPCFGCTGLLLLEAAVT